MAKEKSIKIISIFVFALVLLVLAVVVITSYLRPAKVEENVITEFERSGTPRRFDPIGKDDYIAGERSAPVQLIVYGDYECSACIKFQNTLKTIVAAFPNEVVIAYRHLPRRGQASAEKAALAAECAGEQGKFFAAHDQLFKISQGSELTDEKITSAVAGFIDDAGKFMDCFESGRYSQKISLQAETARLSGADGTPAFFINGNLYIGAYPFEDYTTADGEARPGLKSLIERELEDVD